MDKEGLFLTCFAVLAIFEVGYYLITPDAVFSLEIGALTSILVVGIVTALFASLNLAGSGESVFGARTAFIASALLCVLFRLEIPVMSESQGGWNLGIISGVFSAIQVAGKVLKTPTIPIGIGLLHPNMTSIFLVEGMGMIGIIGLLCVSLLVAMTVISGMLIIAGDG